MRHACIDGSIGNPGTGSHDRDRRAGGSDAANERASVECPRLAHRMPPDRVTAVPPGLWACKYHTHRGQVKGDFLRDYEQ